MPLTDPPAAPTVPPTYSTPSHADLAAVAATVSIVGILMAILVTWLILRLRRPNPQHIPRRPTSLAFPRPSFAPSEASSKFGFIRKSLRLSHRHDDGSWDFADPDPFSEPRRSPSHNHRPAPLAPVPAYTPRTRTSTYKDEYGPRTPTTPASIDYVEPPPPAYCRDSAPWPKDKDIPPA